MIFQCEIKMKIQVENVILLTLTRRQLSSSTFKKVVIQMELLQQTTHIKFIKKRPLHRVSSLSQHCMCRFT